VTLFTSLRRRRIEFAVLSALGLGRRQVLALLTFEFALTAAIGIGIGAVLGNVVSRVMLSFLNVTETGQKVTPPFVLVTNWTEIGAALGCLVVVVFAGIFMAARVYTSGSASTVLRGTD
jgi:ABC-type antimicrobial peptide transport system permease subunit